MSGTNKKTKILPLIVVLLITIISVSSAADDSNSSNLGSGGNALSPRIEVPSCVFGVNGVSFLMYTRDFPEGKKIGTNASAVDLDPDKPVAFLVHGFVSEANSSDFYSLIQALLNKRYPVVLSLDWEDEACNNGMSILDRLSYLSAYKNAYDVGWLLAYFMLQLVEQGKTQMDNVYIIGHSLGAHVAGFAGKAAYKISNKKFGMIVGLDPAGPLFERTSCEHRLCKTDATCVQAFHTSLPLGIRQSVAHDDFYFNYGVVQPGCDLSCSHSRSVTYFTNSLRDDCKFIGTSWTLGSIFTRRVSECTTDTCAVAGLEAFESPARGTFYVPLGKGPLYCTVQNSSDTSEQGTL